MIYRTPIRRFAVLVALFLAVGIVTLHAQDATKRGRKYKAPPSTSRIEITVVRDSSGKPIENASVVFHELNEAGHDSGNMELKTNEDGKTIIDVIAIGATLRVQIIAKGFQTFGKDYPVDKPELAFEIRMKRPGEQYSIYKDHPEDKKPDQDQKPNQDKKPDEQQKPQP